MRVKIKKIPTAAYGGQQPNGALDVTPSAWGGADVDSKGQKLNVRKTLTSVPRKEANLEAEGGETAFGPISGDTIPDHMTIIGPRHSKGGVPLDLPEDTFIFSDTSKMKISDPNILMMFGKSKKKGGYTPADLAKPYDINKYKAILMDKDSDRLDRENAELMIKNYIMKLGALAIAQESKKGFPQGIPEMARPYMEANGISEEDLMPQQEQEGQPEMPEGEMGEGGTPEYPHGGAHSPFEMSMEKAKEIDFTALSAPNLQGPQGQYTEDETLGNIYGDEPAVRKNTEGEFYENQKQEGTQGQDISYEVGVKNAYDVDGNMLADQAGYMAGVATNIGEQVKTSKKMKSIFDKSVDQGARENVFSGLHYANTPGVVAPSGVSPTTVQYKRSQYGGALNKFVYGGDEPNESDPNYANIDFSKLTPEQSSVAQSKEFRTDPRSFRGEVPFGVRRQQRKANKELMDPGMGAYGIPIVGTKPFNWKKNARVHNNETNLNQSIDNVNSNGSFPNSTTHDFTKVGKFAHNISPWNWTKDKQVRSNPTRFAGKGQRIRQYGGEYADGGSANNPNMHESCPKGKFYSQITEKCESLANLKQIYHDAAYTARNAKSGVKEYRPGMNLTYNSEMQKAFQDYTKSLEGEGDYLESLGQGVYHVGSQAVEGVKRMFDFQDGGSNPPQPQYKLYNKEGRITENVTNGQEYLDTHPDYTVGKTGNVYTQEGDFAGKGFGEFYKAPDHIPFSQMGARTFASNEMAYGGSTMAMYGAEMGGAYYPTMSTGGSSRVRITSLPSLHNGGVGRGHPHSWEEADEKSQEEYDAATGEGWRIETDEQGRQYKVYYKAGKAVAGTKQNYVAGNEPFTGGDQAWLDGEACSKIKASGMTVADFIANHSTYPLWDYSNAKYNAYLAKCENVAKGEAEVEKAIKVVDTPNPQECQCKLLDSEGNWTGKYEQYEGTLNEETGELECPDCEYEEEITTDPPEYEEPARWSQRAIGNLLTQGRFRTDAERLDPFLVDEPEYSPVLQRRYDQDIQSNLAGLRGSIDSGGGTAQQKLFQNLAALDQATTQVGKRQKQTEDYNVNVLNQAAQISANLQQGTDAKNQQSMMNARRYNAQAGDKETSARNAKMQAMNLAKTDAQNEMLQKATWNFNNPEFQIDYKTGMPYYDPNYKEPNPTKGQKDLTAEYKRILGDLGVDDEGNKQVAYNLAVKSVYGNVKTKQYGGYISGNDMYPFFND